MHFPQPPTPAARVMTLITAKAENALAPAGGEMRFPHIPEPPQAAREMTPHYN
ncbi:MAG: hypothetical protein IKP95_08480 [Ruminococcus sp.]|nr:hypothetical protein [Ruminococcus sp.]